MRVNRSPSHAHHQAFASCSTFGTKRTGFAITYHRKLRSKRILNTELDLIKGVGKKRATELLEAFGSVQGVKFATEEQINDFSCLFGQ